MVLFQVDDDGHEHVVYYLSKSLFDVETWYSHIEKLALAAVIVVQRFWHYILLHKTTIIANSNPMHRILTQQVLGGKYSYWIIILQEFDLDFAKTKSKNSLVFVELMCHFPNVDNETRPLDSLPNIQS